MCYIGHPWQHTVTLLVFYLFFSHGKLFLGLFLNSENSFSVGLACHRQCRPTPSSDWVSGAACPVAHECAYKMHVLTVAVWSRYRFLRRPTPPLSEAAFARTLTCRTGQIAAAVLSSSARHRRWCWASTPSVAPVEQCHQSQASCALVQQQGPSSRSHRWACPASAVGRVTATPLPRQ
jgi:hypothetical protein